MYNRPGQRRSILAEPVHGQRRTPENRVRFVEGVRDVISEARSARPQYPSQKLPVYRSSGRHYDMLDMIAAYPTLRNAAEAVRYRGELPGSDHRTYYEEIQAPGINEYLRETGHALKEGRYEFSKLRRRRIPKQDGSKRPLDIPTIKDRVVETSIASILYEWCSPTWLDTNMGFRRGISNLDVMLTLHEMTIPNEKYVWLSTDIADAFGSIPHSTLMEIIEKEIPHEGVLQLIRKWLRSDSWKNKDGRKNRGIPQGSPLSPLMLNIFLNHVLDQPLHKTGTQVIRYVDDLLFPCHDHKEAAQKLEDLKKRLQPWGLKIKQKKTIIENVKKTKIPYIGFLISADNDELDMTIDTRKCIFNICMELQLRAQMNNDCRAYSVKVKDQSALAKLVIEGWLKHYAPAITNGVLDQVIKGIKGTMLDLNIHGIKTQWIWDIWNKHRNIWNERKRIKAQAKVQLAQDVSAPSTPQTSTSNGGVPGSLQPDESGSPWDSTANTATNPAMEDPKQPQTGKRQKLHTHGVEDQLTQENPDTAPFSPTSVQGPNQSSDKDRLIPSTKREDELEGGLSSYQIEQSHEDEIDRSDFPRGKRHARNTTPACSETQGNPSGYVSGQVRGYCSSDTSVEQSALENDAARGIKTDDVQHAALWLFDGSEFLPAPVVVLDPSAPRRPGPMDQDWALKIAE